MKKLLCLTCAVLLVAGCADNKRTAPQEGRIAVRPTASLSPLTPANGTVQLAAPTVVTAWTQAGANAQNKLPHATIDVGARKLWETNIGKGLTSSCLTLTEPIVVNDTVYALDADFNLSAVNLADGKRLWKTKLPVNREIGVISVGLVYDNGTLFAVSGNGTVHAVQPDGTIAWTTETNRILRSAPVVANGQMYVLAANNELVALKTTDGSEVWRYKTLATDTNLLGMGRAAVSGNLVIAPFSNGEVIAFDTATGVVRWKGSLLSYRTFNHISDLTHILASPVVDGDTVYLVGNAGRSGGFDVKTGTPKFVQPIAGQNTPAVSGNALFLLTRQNVLAALDKTTGQLMWETVLTSKSSKPAVWDGPVLANNHAVLVSDKGDVVFVDGATGQIARTEQTDALSLKPIMADNKMIFLSNDADLIVYQ